MNFDYFVFQFINDWAGHWKILDNIVIFLAAWWQYFLGAGVLLFLVWKKKKAGWRKSLALAVYFFGTALVSRMVFAEILKRGINRLRPFELHQVTQLLPYDTGQSFPSGHMSFFFGLSLVVYLYIRKNYPQYSWWAGLFLFGGSFLMGLARIFTGVHYPSDILGGMILGILVGWGSWMFLKKFFHLE